VVNTASVLRGEEQRKGSVVGGEEQRKGGEGGVICGGGRHPMRRRAAFSGRFAAVGAVRGGEELGSERREKKK
jgi:hypothetical protein